MSDESPNEILYTVMLISLILILPLGIIYYLILLVSGKKEKAKWAGKSTVIAFIFNATLAFIFIFGVESFYMLLMNIIIVVVSGFNLLVQWSEIEDL